MTIKRSKRRLPATKINEVASHLLEASTLCSISTVSGRGGAHVNTAYFAWSPEFDVVWLSDPSAVHSRNLRRTPSAAVAVYDSTQTWGSPDRGIQLFGSARETTGEAARDSEQLYAKRFRSYAASDFAGYSFYRFRPRRMKLFDESALGAGVFVTASVVRRGRVRWERTEILASSGT